MAKIVTTTITEQNVDIVNNKSDLVFTLFINPNNTSTYCTNRPLTITCNGVTQSGSLTVPKGGSATLTFTFANIYHESDGSKSVNWSWNCPTSTSGLGNLEYSGTYTMQTIPRASSFSNVNINYIDDTMYFSIDKKSSNFTSSIRLLFTGNTSNPSDRFPVDVCSKDGRTYIPFNIDTNSNQYKGILQYNSNKTEIPLEVELTTYNGNAQIGTSTSTNATAKIKKIVPTVNATIIDTNPTTVEFTGDNTKIIRYLSKPKVTINAIPYQEASIKSYSIIADGGTYYVQEKQFDSGITSPQITVNAMDTRNWDNPTLYDLSTNGKWINYEKVMLNCEYCERIEQTSSTIKCKLTGTFFNNTINGTANSLALSYRYRKQGEDWQDNWIVIPSDDVTINGNNFSYTANALRTDCSDLESWEFQFKANDILMTSPIITKQITLGLGIVEIGKEFVNINSDFFVKDYPVKPVNDMGDITVDSITSKNLIPCLETETITLNKLFKFDRPLPIGTYTISIDGISSNGTSGLYLFEFLTDTGASPGYQHIYFSNNSITINTHMEFNMVYLYSQDSYANSQGITTIFSKIMLEKGDKATSYAPYKEYGNNIQTLNVSITNGQTYQNDILKNAKLVIVNWNVEWNMQTIHLDSGYSLNTYSNYSVGSIFDKTLGTIKYQHSTDTSFTINKIFVIK